jgi:hypothetical protein
MLSELGPCVSGKLVEAVVARHQLSPDAARQRLSRCKSVKRLAYIRFPKNARFVYPQSEYGSPRFWDALIRALLEETSAYGSALAALMARGGLIPVAHFGSASGAPIAQKRHLSARAVLEHLERAGLVQKLTLPGLGECVRLSETAFPEGWEVSRIRGRIHVEDVLLLAIRDWLRKLSMVSYDAVKVRSLDAADEQPRVGTLNWDLSGPSYLAHLADWSPDGARRPGFVACDVLLGRPVGPRDLQPFISKCETLRGLKNVARCMQIFVAEGYTKEAFELAKKKGVVPASPEALFGTEVAEALKELASLLHNAFVTSNNAERIAEVFKRLSKIEGVATNLRGALFEYIVADLVSRSSMGTTVRMNEIVLDGLGGSAEVDVLAARHGHSIRFIECKGYKPGGPIPDELVERWLQDRLPLIRRAAKTNTFWRKESLEFEFWTSGTLSAAAKEMVAKAQAVGVGKYTVKVIAHDELKAICDAFGDKALQDTMAEHFFEHPLQTIDRDIAKRLQREASRQARRLATVVVEPSPGILFSPPAIPEWRPVLNAPQHVQDQSSQADAPVDQE